MRDKVSKTKNREHVAMARQDGTPTGTAPGETTGPRPLVPLANRRTVGPPAPQEEPPPYEPLLSGPRGRRGVDGVAGANGRPGKSPAPAPEFDEPYTEPQFMARRGAPGGAGATGPAGARGRAGQPAIEFEEPAIEPNLRGVRGRQGDKGGLRFNFSTATADADPTAGLFRYNNATLASVNLIFIDNLTQEGADVGAFFDMWDDSTSAPRSFILVTSNVNGNPIVHVWRMGPGVQDRGGYRAIAVVLVSGTVLPADGDPCVVSWARTGDAGTNGTNGTNGAPGARGPRGYALPSEFDESIIEPPIPGRRGRTGAAGAATMTAFTQDLGVARSSGTFDITGLAGLTIDKVVTIVQTAAAIASKGNARDEPEMDQIQVTGYVVDAATIRAYWCAPSVVVGTYAFSYAVNG